MNLDPQSAWPDSVLAPYGETLTVQQIAEALCIAPETVRAAIVHPDPVHRLPAVKFGKVWLIGTTDLKQYLRQRRNSGANA